MSSKHRRRQDGAMDVDTILCLYCRASIHFVGLPAHRYSEHLFKEHNILFDIDAIIDRTLQMQIPGYNKEGSESAGLKLDVSIQADVVNLPKLDPWTKTMTRGKSDVTVGEKIPVSKPTRTITLPWFSGCEYQCQICKTIFYYVEELRTHIKKKHCKPDDYLDKHKKFETKVVHYNCQICRMKIKRNFAAICKHLTNTHVGVSLMDYQKKFNLSEYSFQVAKYKSESDDEEKDEEVLEKAKAIPKRLSLQIKMEKPNTSDAISPPTSSTPSKRRRTEANDNQEPAVEASRNEKWYEGCEYQCRVCQKIFFEPDNLLFHARNIHNLTGKSYKKKFNKFETLSLTYECEICHCNIKHRKSVIESHILNKHNMKEIQNYEDIFYPSLNNETKAKDPEEAHDDAVPQQENNSEDAKFSSLQEFRNGACVFQCTVCEYKISSSIHFWAHATNKHNLDVKKYKIAYGDPCVSKGKIECPLCFKIVRHEPGSLKIHAKSHKMTVQQYYEKYFAETKVEAKKVLPFTPVESVNYKEMLIWANKCRYQCKICNMSFKNHVKIMGHIKSAHDMTVSAYKAKHGDMMTTKKTHKCLICQRVIVQSHIAIRFHAQRKHSMKVVDYYLNHVKRKRAGEESAEKINTDSKEEEKEPNDVGIKNAPSDSALALLATKDPAEKARIAKKASKWANPSVYNCQKCDFKHSADGTMANHTKNKHKMTINQMKMKLGPMRKIKALYHNCLVCDAKCKWNGTDLKQHLKKRHELTLTAYYLKYVGEQLEESKNQEEEEESKLQEEEEESKNQEEEDNEDTDQEGSNISKQTLLETSDEDEDEDDNDIFTVKHKRAAAGEDSIEKINTDSKEEEKEQNEVGIENVPSDPALALWATKDTAEKARMSKRASNWANPGVFKCQKCDFKHTSTSSMDWHSKKKHKMTLAQMKMKLGPIIKNKSLYHNCLVCDAKCKWKGTDLNQHFRKEHKLTLTTYYWKYIKKQGEESKNQEEEEESKNQKEEDESKHQEEEEEEFKNQEEDNEDTDQEGTYISKQTLLETSDEDDEDDDDNDIFSAEDPLRLSDSLRSISEEIVKNRNEISAETITGSVSEMQKEPMQENRGNSCQESQVIPSQQRSSETTKQDLKLLSSWMNGCVYRCAKCTGQLSSKRSFSEHITVHDNMDFGTYTDLFGDPTVVINLLRCRICSDIIQHERDEIQEHLSHHDMTMEQYFEQFVKNTVDLSHDAEIENGSEVDFDCGPEDNSHQSRLDLKEDYTNLLMEEEDDSTSSFAARQLEVAVGSAGVEAVGESRAKKKKEKYTFNWSQCQYYCTECKRSFNRWGWYPHVTKVHFGTATTDTELCRQTIYKHACLLCHNEIRFEVNSIYYHLKAAHGISLKSYEEKFDKEIRTEMKGLELFKKNALRSQQGLIPNPPSPSTAQDANNSARSEIKLEPSEIDIDF